MGISSERVDGVLILQAWERIDSTNARDFEAAAMSEIGADDRAVLIDMSDLSYISSAGLRALLVVAKALRSRNARFALCVLVDRIKSVFEISGFDRIIAIHPGRKEALASLRA